MISFQNFSSYFQLLPLELDWWNNHSQVIDSKLIYWFTCEENMKWKRNYGWDVVEFMRISQRFSQSFFKILLSRLFSLKLWLISNSATRLLSLLFSLILQLKQSIVHLLVSFFSFFWLIFSFQQIESRIHLRSNNQSLN